MLVSVLQRYNFYLKLRKVFFYNRENKVRFGMESVFCLFFVAFLQNERKNLIFVFRQCVCRYLQYVDN